MQINAHSFITAVKAVLPFAGVNDVRYYLNGVHVLSTDNGMTIEATDGHTAARVFIDGVYGYTKIILDRVTASRIAKLKVRRAERGTAALSWAAEGGISFDGLRVNVEPIDGIFPDVGRVLAKSTGNANEYGANAAYMERAFKSAGLLSNPKYHGVKMHAGGRDDVVLLEVPTDHGAFSAISKPAFFAVMPMRL